MPTLVHIADEKNTSRIKRAGIAPGKESNVVYFMPVVRNHFISHQWLRELKRSGAKTLVGVYFRLPVDELVWAGKYNEQHKQIRLGEAIRDLEAMADPLGYEMFFERKVTATEIERIRHLPQKLGWRYMPNAHGRAPCPCPSCLRRGEYGAARIREKFDPPSLKISYVERLQKIATSNEWDELYDCLAPFCGKTRKTDPSFLARLMEFDDAFLVKELARTLGYFNHKNSKTMLLTLCENPSADVRQQAAKSLTKLFPHEFPEAPRDA